MKRVEPAKLVNTMDDIVRIWLLKALLHKLQIIHKPEMTEWDNNVVIT